MFFLEKYAILVYNIVKD